jgi:hypothetical protein
MTFSGFPSDGLCRETDPLAALARLRPRDTDFVRFDSADPLTARQIVGGLTPEQCLVASAAAGPLVWQVVVEQLGGDDATVAFCDLLRCPSRPGAPSSPSAMRDLTDCARSRRGNQATRLPTGCSLAASASWRGWRWHAPAPTLKRLSGRPRSGPIIPRGRITRTMRWPARSSIYDSTPGHCCGRI